MTKTLSKIAHALLVAMKRYTRTIVLFVVQTNFSPMADASIACTMPTALTAAPGISTALVIVAAVTTKKHYTTMLRVSFLSTPFLSFLLLSFLTCKL